MMPKRFLTIILALFVFGCDYEEDENIIEDFRSLWTGFTSEESPPITCGYRYVTRGADCTGKYCDNVRLECDYIGGVIGDSTFTSFFSEEGSGGADERICPGTDEWMTGISCSGSYCDSISLKCTEFIGSATGGCAWSGWYSEETGPFSAPAGRYVKGVECDGAYCDNKRYRYCWMN